FYNLKAIVIRGIQCGGHETTLINYNRWPRLATPTDSHRFPDTPAARFILLIDLTHAYRPVSMGTGKPSGRIRSAPVFNNDPIYAEVFLEPTKVFGAKVFPSFSGLHLFKPGLGHGGQRISDGAVFDAISEHAALSQSAEPMII